MNSNLYYEQCKRLRSLPVTLYAIGTKKNVRKDFMLHCATRPEYVKAYPNVKTFASDVASISTESCRIGSQIDTGINGSPGEIGSVNDIGTSVKVIVKGLKVGQSRYYKAGQSFRRSNFKSRTVLIISTFSELRQSSVRCSPVFLLFRHS